MSKWSSDIVDASILTKEKVQFIYELADQNLGETLQAADDIIAKATKATATLLVVFLVLSSAFLFKCDVAAASCSAGRAFFYPCLILIGGYALSITVLIFGALRTRPFCFRGNEPRNLLTTEICNLDIVMIIASSAMSMQESISHNVVNSNRIAKLLQYSYWIAGTTPILAVINAFLW